MPQKQPLTFEQFVERDSKLQDHPRYDNFPQNFTTEGVVAELIRKQSHILKFIEEHPDLEKRLREGIMNRDRSIDTDKAFKPLEPDMYEAYLIMHGYGISDENLYIKTF